MTDDERGAVWTKRHVRYHIMMKL